MRIGIDIDGVLTDLERWQIEYGSSYFIKKNIPIYNYEGYTTAEIFNVASEIDKEFWNLYRSEYCTNTKARSFASEVINKLKEENNEIYIITARVFTSENTKRGEDMRTTVKKWLEKNNIFYDKIIFSPEEKLEICRENKIDLMIEDFPENINPISKIIPVICYHAEYNKDSQGPNIYRAYSWHDIYYQIKSIKN